MSEEKAPQAQISRKPEVLEANRRWLALVNAQSENHRENRDPRLYRQSSKDKLITPKRSQ
ncbi:MAG: hypothetical protein ACRBBR_10720 [Cellvibrionaceae bacterium]